MKSLRIFLGLGLIFGALVLASGVKAQGWYPFFPELSSTSDIEPIPIPGLISSEGAMWRYDLAHTAEFPAADAPTAELIFQYTSPMAWAGSPVVTDTAVYIAYDIPYHSVVAAIVPDAGEEIWSAITDENSADFEGILAIAGDTILANTRGCNGINSLYAFDAYSGELKWKFTNTGCAVPPAIVANNTVYTGSRALDINDGSVLRFYGPDGGIWSVASIYEGKVYFGTTRGYVYALDAQTGELIWETKIGDYVDSTPAIAGGIVYTTADYWSSSGARLCALNAETGEVIWLVNPYPPGASTSNHYSPTVANNVVYLPQRNHYVAYDYKIFAFDAQTGTQLWEYIGNTDPSPVFCDDKIYCVGYAGSKMQEIYLLDAATGDKLESYLISKNRPYGLTGPPFIKNGWVFQGNADGLHVFSDGSPWLKHAPEITSTPATEVYKKRLYEYDVEASDADGDLLTYALIDAPQDMQINSETGLIRWRPQNQDLGTHHIVVEADDGQGGKDRQFYYLQVKQIGRPGLRPKIK